MRPPITQKCLETICFLDDKHLKSLSVTLGGLVLQYRTPEIEHPSREIENGSFRMSKGRKFE